MSSTPSSSRKRPALPRTSSWRSITESTVARIDHLFRPSAAQDLAPAENSTGEHAIDHQDTGKASSVLPSPPHPRSLSAPQSISQSYSTTFPMSSGRGTEGGNNIEGSADGSHHDTPGPTHWLEERENIPPTRPTATGNPITVKKTRSRSRDGFTASSSGCGETEPTHLPAQCQPQSETVQKNMATRMKSSTGATPRSILRSYTAPDIEGATASSKPVDIPWIRPHRQGPTRHVSFTDKDDVYIINSSGVRSVRDTIAAYENLRLNPAPRANMEQFQNTAKERSAEVPMTPVKTSGPIEPERSDYFGDLSAEVEIANLADKDAESDKIPPPPNTNPITNRTSVNTYPWSLVRHRASSQASSPSRLYPNTAIVIYNPATSGKVPNHTSIDNPDFDRRKIRTFASPMRGPGGRLLNDLDMSIKLKMLGESMWDGVWHAANPCPGCGEELRLEGTRPEGKVLVCERCRDGGDKLGIDFGAKGVGLGWS